MELHTLKKNPGAKKKRKRVGRGPGSGTGKTAGRGHKGQQSRSGYSRHYGFEGGQMPLHRRLPKRGFHHDDRWPMSIVNIDRLMDVFEDGATVTSGDIVKAGLAREEKGGVKVLGRGDATKKLQLKVQAIAKGAQAKIEAAGGTVAIISIKDKVKDTAQASAPEASASEGEATQVVAEEVTADETAEQGAEE